MQARKWFSVTEVAKICHEANRQMQRSLGDLVSAPWDDLDVDMQQSVEHGVRVAQEGGGPEELHRQWSMVKEAQGWVYGPIKDEDKKEHPNLVEWNSLPYLQRAKDQLFYGVVSSLREPTKEGVSE